jgi:hypothetical protein
MFPNNATVESNFLIMRYEKNYYRQRLSDVALAGIIHAKQRKEIKKMPLALVQGHMENPGYSRRNLCSSLPTMEVHFRTSQDTVVPVYR